MKVLRFTAKCSDMFSADLRDVSEPKGIMGAGDDKDLGSYEGYVPDFFPGEHYGDYVQLDIDIDTGRILNWKKPTKKDLAIFKANAAYRIV